MSETFDTLSVVGRHLEDPHDPSTKNPHDVPNPVTGFYEVGVMVEGAFRPIARFKASGLFADIERAKQSQTDTPPAES